MKKLFVCLLAACLLSGCSAQPTAKVKLYFAGVGGQTVREETRTVAARDSVLETAVRALLSGPRTLGSARVIPKGTELIGVKMRGTVAEINLSAPFDTGTDEERLLARYTVIYTACAVPDVQKVKLLVEGKPIESLESGFALGALGKGDLTLSEPTGGAQALLTLYFADPNTNKLLPETRQVSLREGQTAAEAVVRELIRGPGSSHLAPTLSPETGIISVENRAGICFVNLNRAFLEENEGTAMQETAAVYSIVNALCTLKEVTEVHFLVEGKTVEKLGHISLAQGFTENKSLYPLA